MNDDPRQDVIRSLLRRFESLRRSGLDRVPVRWPGRLVAPPSAPGAAAALREALAASRAPARPAEAPETPPRIGRPERTAPAPTATPAPAPASLSGAAAVERVLATTGSLFGDEGFAEPALPADRRAEALQAQCREVAGCTRCPHLAATRTQTVFGVGSPTARLMFIGEAPGADEDRLGEPFVGRAGGLLTDMITKGMGLRREDVYIANILKCRPPNNRDPEPAEVASCIGYLERQIATIRPEFLCLLGRVAAQRLLDTAMPMGRLRGRWHRYKGVPTLVTYHPAYLLRNPAGKAEAWEDLKMLMRAMGLKVPERKKAPRDGG